MTTPKPKGASDIAKNFAALDLISKARLTFEKRICEASQSQDEDVLDTLRLDGMFEFAQFFYSIAALELTGPDDIKLLADLHNDNLTRLSKDKKSLARRKLRYERVLDAMFTSDTQPRLEQLWKETPGALDQANLGRFLATQMSSETVRKFVIGCEKAGFLTQKRHPFGVKAVQSTGVMEQILDDCLNEMRDAIATL